jgi:archaellum biogenesis protein FlaJ (TadC family)
MSLGLAIIFWILSTKQTNEAKKTLDEIKTKIITWQADLNKAALNIISARPEIIAKDTAIKESMTLSEFSNRLSALIESGQRGQAQL